MDGSYGRFTAASLPRIAATETSPGRGQLTTMAASLSPTDSACYAQAQQDVEESSGHRLYQRRAVCSCRPNTA